MLMMNAEKRAKIDGYPDSSESESDIGAYS